MQIFNGRKCNSDHWWNNDKSRCECKKHHVRKKNVLNPSACNCKNGKYLSSIMDNTAIMCDEVTESFDEEVEAKSYDLEKQFQQILTIKISLI